MTQPAIIDTSVAAYEAVKPKVPSIRARVLQLVESQNGVGVSRTQIASILGINEITAGSRLTELLQSGKVKRKGETVRSTSGKQEHLYVLGDGVPADKPAKGAIPAKAVAAILGRFGITSREVVNEFSWAEQPEGPFFWSTVHAILLEAELNANA